MDFKLTFLTILSLINIGTILMIGSGNYFPLQSEISNVVIYIISTSSVILQIVISYYLITIKKRRIKIPAENLKNEVVKYLETGEISIEHAELPSEYEELKGSISRILATIEHVKHENQMVKKTKDTEIFTLKRELDIQKEATLRVLKEIDEEKEISQARAQELQKFQLAVEEASDHIVITDADGLVLYTNPSGERITGFTRDEIIGTKAGVLWGGQMDFKFYEEMWTTIKDNKREYKGELTNIKKDGQKYVAEISISPILNDANQVIFFVSIQRDVTKAREVDRMKTEFISLASHQLRAPLAAIRWGLESLLQGVGGQLEGVQNEMTKDAYESATRMVDLVNGLLNVSRLESGRLIIDPKPTNVTELVEGVIKEVGVGAHSRDQKLEYSIEDNLPEINLDPRLIRNVYMNFLTNAIKYTPNEGEIVLSIYTEGDKLVSKIKDNGYGIPEKEQSQLFDKFFRANNIRKYDTDGTGLGLYLVKSIIEASGGEIWFESKENLGTTFWFSLPMEGMKSKQGEVSLEELKKDF